MRRTALAGALLAGKGFDAVSTAVVLSLSDPVREAVPLSRALMAAFGPAGGVAVLTLLVLAVFVPLAETGAPVERRWPEETPDWYAPTLRASVYLGPAAWFRARRRPEPHAPAVTVGSPLHPVLRGRV